MSKILDLTLELHVGVPIYIDSVSADKGTANIHPLSEPDDHQTVNVSSLTEAPQ